MKEAVNSIIGIFLDFLQEMLHLLLICGQTQGDPVTERQYYCVEEDINAFQERVPSDIEGCA